MYSDTVLPVLVGAFEGQFGAIHANLGPSEAPVHDIEANLGWILPLYLAQNDINTLK